ncbi:hypothetical protein APHAL10511_005743 [Amanita phalloides]|nr:hypothetical protein APHAL10511_005743 [Amanita phalloides]
MASGAEASDCSVAYVITTALDSAATSPANEVNIATGATSTSFDGEGTSSYSTIASAGSARSSDSSVQTVTVTVTRQDPP